MWNLSQAGYRASVAIEHWLPDATLTIEFPKDYSLHLLATYAAHLVSSAGAAGAASFQLAAQPDGAYGGFGFTARGATPPVEELRVTCDHVSAEMLASPPPASDCPLGATFAYLEQWTGGFEAEVRSIRSSLAASRSRPHRIYSTPLHTQADATPMPRVTAGAHSIVACGRTLRPRL